MVKRTAVDQLFWSAMTVRDHLWHEGDRQHYYAPAARAPVPGPRHRDISPHTRTLPPRKPPGAARRTAHGAGRLDRHREGQHEAGMISSPPATPRSVLTAPMPMPAIPPTSIKTGAPAGSPVECHEPRDSTTRSRPIPTRSVRTPVWSLVGQAREPARADRRPEHAAHHHSDGHRSRAGERRLPSQQPARAGGHHDSDEPDGEIQRDRAPGRNIRRWRRAAGAETRHRPGRAARPGCRPQRPPSPPPESRTWGRLLGRNIRSSIAVCGAAQTL